MSRLQQTWPGGVLAAVVAIAIWPGPPGVAAGDLPDRLTDREFWDLSSGFSEAAPDLSAFYLSNVEQYLRPGATWGGFCTNVAAMPIDDTSTFIRSARGGRRTGGDAFGLFVSSLGLMVEEVEGCPVS